MFKTTILFMAVNTLGLSAYAESINVIHEYARGESAIFCDFPLENLNKKLLKDVIITSQVAQPAFQGLTEYRPAQDGEVMLMKMPFTVSAPSVITYTNSNENRTYKYCTTLTKK